MKYNGKEVGIFGAFADQKAVSYAPQTLTPDEQAQARLNIGVTGGADIKIDATLSQAGQAADAGAVGTVLAQANQALTGMNAAIENIGENVEVLASNSLPSVTTADNGKILSVVGGKWAAVTVETWAGGSY